VCGYVNPTPINPPSVPAAGTCRTVSNSCPLEQLTGVPPAILTSLWEAQKFLKAGTYDASVVMSGRAIEGICRQFGVGHYLGNGMRTALGEVCRGYFRFREA
jgi:hypothetical protein